jgi:hypothetical protein
MTNERTIIAEEIYNFICSNYNALKEEYQRIPKAERLRLPFPAFCVAFWDEITPKEQTYLEQISNIFDKTNGLN